MPKKRATPDNHQETFSAPPLSKPLPIIKIVGISGSGKSTLVRGLRAKGYDARPVSQEHSNVPTLWQQFDRPDYLIYLHATLEDQATRRHDVSWTAEAHYEETKKLTHAREHADLRIDTGKLDSEQVLAIALSFLKQWRVRHADHPLEALPNTGSATKPRSEQ